MKVKGCEVYVLVDADGDYTVGKTEQEARENYGAMLQPMTSMSLFRVVKATLTVSLPCVEEVEAIVPPPKIPKLEIN